jgi:hypothetical protein
MPTLDDIPTLAAVSTVTGDDLFPVFDPTATGSSKVRKIALNQINGLNADDVVTDADAGSITISSRVLVISGGTTSTLTLPAASGALRELFVVNDGSGTATLPTLAAGTEAVTAGTSAHLLSNGTGWYRVS